MPPQTPPQPPHPTRPPDAPPERAPARPWRTEGMPDGSPPKRKFAWTTLGFWALAYLVLFIGLTVQDRLQGPHAVTYTEFKTQVEQGNVAEVFARGNTIQGSLRKAAALPGQADQTYQAFTTERPTFANDDLLRELADRKASVRATPLVRERGFLTNLLISMAPILLLVGFYVYMFRRQQRLMGGGLFGGGTRKPVDPDSVRVTFNDVAGIDEVEAEISEIVDFLREPDKYRKVGARAPKGAPARRSWPAPRPARPTCRSSAPAPPSSSR
jgi:cell division protease FtsH